MGQLTFPSDLAPPAHASEGSLAEGVGLTGLDSSQLLLLTGFVSLKPPSQVRGLV